MNCLPWLGADQVLGLLAVPAFKKIVSVLTHAVRHNHSWLHPGPTDALETCRSWSFGLAPAFTDQGEHWPGTNYSHATANF